MMYFWVHSSKEILLFELKSNTICGSLRQGLGTISIHIILHINKIMVAFNFILVFEAHDWYNEHQIAANIIVGFFILALTN